VFSKDCHLTGEVGRALLGSPLFDLSPVTQNPCRKVEEEDKIHVFVLVLFILHRKFPSYAQITLV